MSVRKLALTIPAAMLALGFVATAASASSQAMSSVTAPAYAQVWNVQKAKVGYARKHRQSATKRKSRFSGFGFRGDGFRASGTYQ